MIKTYDFCGFIFEDHLLSILEFHLHCDCLFENLIFVDDKLPMKTAKIMSLENLYAYGNYYTFNVPSVLLLDENMLNIYTCGQHPNHCRTRSLASSSGPLCPSAVALPLEPLYQ